MRHLLLFILQFPLPASDGAGGMGSGMLLVASFISQIKINGVVSWAIQIIKESENPAWQWINKNTPWVTRATAAAGAGFTALGLHALYTPAHGATAGQLLITGLSLAAIVNGAWNVAQTYLMQHAWYKTVFQPKQTVQAVIVPAVPADPMPSAMMAPSSVVGLAPGLVRKP